MEIMFQNHEDIFECRRSNCSTEIIRGIIVSESQTLILLNKLTDSFQLDGYILLRHNDVTEYRFYDDKKYFEKKVQQKFNLKGSSPSMELDISSMQHVLSSLLKSKILFSFEKEKSYKNILWLGKLRHLTDSSFFFKELDAEAIWGPISRHMIHSITKIELETMYINMYRLLC